MRRESHRYRGVRRRSAAGWGHRAVYVAAAVATASLVSGFALAGYWFGTFSHVFAQATSQGLETAPYHVEFVGMGATNAILLGFMNFNNSSSAPCSTLAYNGTAGGNPDANAGNLSNNSVNLSATNYNNTDNASVDYYCLNAVNSGNITEMWGNWTAQNNSTSWQNITDPANASFSTPYYNNSLTNISGVNNSARVNVTGCNPLLLGNSSQSIGNFTDCDFFASNNNTTFLPHAGFWNVNYSGATPYWISEINYSAPNTSALWHPNQTGYLPSDEVFFASVEFYSVAPNVTYEVDVAFQGATPVPEVVYVNTGGTAGANYTLVFVFDETIAWTTALTGNMTGLNDTNYTGTFDSVIIAQIGTVSVTVSQCYVDHSGLEACPVNTIGIP